MLRSSSACSSTGLVRASSGLGFACAEVCAPEELADCWGEACCAWASLVGGCCARAMCGTRDRRIYSGMTRASEGNARPSRLARVGPTPSHIMLYRFAVGSNYVLRSVHRDINVG